jgi:hypothetical protein
MLHPTKQSDNQAGYNADACCKSNVQMLHEAVNPTATRSCMSSQPKITTARNRYMLLYTSAPSALASYPPRYSARPHSTEHEQGSPGPLPASRNSLIFVVTAAFSSTAEHSTCLMPLSASPLGGKPQGTGYHHCYPSAPCWSQTGVTPCKPGGRCSWGNGASLHTEGWGTPGGEGCADTP